MKVFHKKVRDRSTIPCEGNCSYLGCYGHFELPTRFRRCSRHGRSSRNRQMSVLATARKGNQMNRGGIEPVINKAD